MLKRSKLKELKELQSEIKARRQAERDAKRQAREDKEKRRKENELKSAAVQVVRVVNCCWLPRVHMLWKLTLCLSLLLDLAHAQNQDDEQEAAAQRQEDNRQQAGRCRVRADLLQVERAASDERQKLCVVADACGRMQQLQTA
jgi:hypothetical protein